MSSETTAGDTAGNYTIVRTFTATDDWKRSWQLSGPGHHKKPDSPSSLPTTPSSAPTGCHGRRHSVRQLRRGDVRSVQRDPLAMPGNYTIVRTFRPPTTLKQLFDHADHRSGTTALVHLRPADYTGCSRDAHGRRHGVRRLRRGDDPSVSETTAGDAEQLHHRSHVHGHRRRWKQLFDPQTIRYRTTALNSPSSVRLHRRVLDEMPMDDATAPTTPAR